MFVSDLDAACAWYERVLGFRTTWRKSDYAALVRGSAMIHLGKSDPPITTAAFYVQVARGIDEYVAAIAAAGEPLLQPLQDHDYGMRYFSVQQKTAYEIYVGQQIG